VSNDHLYVTNDTTANSKLLVLIEPKLMVAVLIRN